MTPLRTALLRELRIGPLWRLRMRQPDAAAEHGADAPAAQPPPHTTTDPAPETITPPAVADRLPLAPPKAPRSLALQPAALAPAPTVDTDRSLHIARLDWPALEQMIRECQACRLGGQRRQAVPGVGGHAADWMFVGEAPGAEEDRRGEPFVGPAGRLLDAMLDALGLARDQRVFIANALKCRPPMNRNPQNDEIDACRPFLERQIALVQPRILIALGRPAARALLQTEVSINAVRGRLFAYGTIPVVVTYHPAYLLRNPADKAKAWVDLCFARRVVAGAPQG